MKPIVGIVCEYDPFHRGHARQFSLVRKALPGARIVCVMSGCFTQRGMPALFSPAFRARAALRAGADAVLELPCLFAVREAEHFALGAVETLSALGGVTHLSFGVETDDLPTLQAVAALLENPNGAFVAALRQALGEGKSFAAAQAEAVASAGIADAQAAARALSLPNNILGVCYLRALLRLKSPLLPLPVIRNGSYHDEALSADVCPSASAVRTAFLSGGTAAAEAACGYPLRGASVHRPRALDAVLIQHLREMDAADLRALPDCTEGLENRLARAVREANSRSDLLALMKTKRYAYARINRLATHALLGVTAQLQAEHPRPEYARLLGFRRESVELLTGFKQSRVPVLAKAAGADRQNPLFTLDERAYDLWALGAELPAGLIYRQAVEIV